MGSSGLRWTVPPESFESWRSRRSNANIGKTPQQLSYLRGLQYRQEKKAHGGDRKTGEKSIPQNEGLIFTAAKLAKKHGVSRATIERDAKFAEAVDVVAEALPETKAKILQGASPLSKGDVIAVAEEVKLAPAEQKPQTATAGLTLSPLNGVPF